jgi:hypothetical protein
MTTTTNIATSMLNRNASSTKEGSNMQCRYFAEDEKDADARCPQPPTLEVTYKDDENDEEERVEYCCDYHLPRAKTHSVVVSVKRLDPENNLHTQTPGVSNNQTTFVLNEEGGFDIGEVEHPLTKEEA